MSLARVSYWVNHLLREDTMKLSSQIAVSSSLGASTDILRSMMFIFLTWQPEPTSRK